MKYFLVIFFTFVCNIAVAQMYSATTNNNVVYDDTTAKVEITHLYNLLQNGHDFKEISLKYSQDPGSYKAGGLLNSSNWERFVEEYKVAVLRLSPGEISKPFKTEYGYHIAQLISNKDGIYNTRHILLRVDWESNK